MIAQVVLVCLAACGAVAFPVDYPGALYSQYHAQDELGQYTFGYSGPAASKHEQKTADGVTRGSYSYVDPFGRLQTRSYTADDVNGFRVAASDLPVGPGQDAAQGTASGYDAPLSYSAPRTVGTVTRWSLTSAGLNGPVQDTPEVAAAKAQHLAAVEQAKLRNGVAGTGSGQYYSTSAAFPVEHRYLNPYVAQPAVAAAPALYNPLPVGLRSQYHAQDEAGQYTFGYANENASKSETKTADGVTRGSYSYVDPNGQIQSRSYVADQDGFRVVASDLPQVQI